MKIEDSFGYLSENSSGCQFSDLPVGQLFYVLSQTDSSDIISNEENLFWAVDQIVQVDNTWVFKSFEAGDLPLACFLFHRVLELDFLIYFHCIFVLIPFVEDEAYLGVCTCPDHFTDLIVIEGLCGFGFLS